MPNIGVVVVHNHVLPPAVSRHFSLSITEMGRPVGSALVAIALGPCYHIFNHVGRVGVTTRIESALVRNRRVSIAMKLHPRHGLSARMAGQRLLVGIEVKSTRNGSKSSNALRYFSVAGENASQAAAIGLSRGIDARSVHTIRSFKMVEKLRVKVTSLMDLGAFGSP